MPGTPDGELVLPITASSALNKLKRWLSGEEAIGDIKDALKFIRVCSHDDLYALGLGPPPPRPVVPANLGLNGLSLDEGMCRVQAIISAFCYNHSSCTYFDARKKRPFCDIMATARAMLREALPLKCVEAVFLGLLLTCGWSEVQRIPLGFKSRCRGKEYRHIVLVLRQEAGGVMGALGLSRRHDLMDKPPRFSRLSDLVADYRSCYEAAGHQLLKVRVGLPAPHNPEHGGRVTWRYCCLCLEKRTWEQTASLLDHHAEAAGSLQEQLNLAAAAASATAKTPRERGGLAKRGTVLPCSPRGTAARAAASAGLPVVGAIAAGSPASPRHRCHGGSSGGRTTAMPAPSPRQRVAPALESPSAVPSPMVKVLAKQVQGMLSPSAAADVHSESSVSSVGDMFDSDSECSSVVLQLSCSSPRRAR